MTLLPAPAEFPAPNPPPPGEETSLFDVTGAGFEAETIETDAWGRRRREERDYLDELYGQLPEDARAEAEAALGGLRKGSEAWKVGRVGVYLTAARRAFDAHPERFGALPRSQRDFDAALDARLKAQHDEATAIIDSGPAYSGAAEFLGRGGAAMTDPISLAMAPAGGPSGSFLRIAAREAFLGASGEALVLPRMYEVSDRLGLPSPDPLTQIGVGALFGAGLGGAMEGGARLIRYAGGERAQSAATVPPGAVEEAAHDGAIEAARRALEADEDPAAALAVADEDVEWVVDQLIRSESGDNPRAVNPSPDSDASGLGQFIPSTWLEMIDRYRPDLRAGRSEKEVLDLRFDPAISREMTMAFTRENLAVLRRRGAPTDPAAVKMAHFSGAPRAALMLNDDPTTPITKYFSEKEMRANASIRWGGKVFAEFTIGDMRRWAAVEMGQAHDPGASHRASTRRGYTTPDQVTTGAGTRVDVDYEVVDLDDLTFADGGLQPRDRSRAASAEQVGEIAAGLDPARLLPSPEVDRGAPLVGPDSVIESGNGRIRAIAMAADEFPDRYEAYVETIRDQFEVPEGVRRPVLIARRTSDLDDAAREALVREANDPTIAIMSSTERAAVEARALTADVMGRYQSGAAIDSAENRDFARAFLAGISQTQRAALVDAGGRLNADGVRRIRSAMFARAFDAKDLVARATETDAAEYRAMIAALTDAAPEWAQLRADVADGLVAPEWDVTLTLAEAVRLIAGARRAAARDGGGIARAIEDALAQGDLIGGADPALLRAAVNVFHDGVRARPQADSAAMLSRYANEARIVGSTEAGLFDAPAARPADVLSAIASGERVEAPPVAAGGTLPPRATTEGFSEGASAPAAIRAADEAEEQLRDLVAPTRAPDPAARREIADAREGGDFTWKDQNGAEMSARAVLDDLEAEADFADQLEICAAGGRNG